MQSITSDLESSSQRLNKLETLLDTLQVNESDLLEVVVSPKNVCGEPDDDIDKTSDERSEHHQDENVNLSPN